MEHKPVHADMNAILEQQKKAHIAASPVSAEVRIDRINRAIDILIENEMQLSQAMSEDFGQRAVEMSRFTDILAAVSALKYARKHVKKWMRPERRAMEFPLGLLGSRAWIEYQPKGVIGIISPWNFPVNLTFAPLAGVFAAGNRAMIKPSEFTPETSNLMKSLFEKAYDLDEVAVITGGPEVGQAFSALAFDHLIFTGATSIARHVMRAAADNLVPLTLELGGKSPVLVGRDANIDQAADRIVMGKMMNAGQVCLAPDYLLVPKEKENEVTDALVDKATQMYPRMNGNPNATSIINDRHFERLNHAVEDARAKGADIRVVNPADEDFSTSNTRMMPLTIIRNVNDDMVVMQDELFGPILPIKGYDNFDEALDYVNEHERPLAAYYFGNDSSEERKVLDKTTSGGVTLQDVIFHMAQDDLPFGGVGPSGMGAYHGIEGFKAVSHQKAIYRQTKFDLASLIGARPPYGKALQRTLSMRLKK
ncbi:MAG: coniferyl aldehyde dehydrogenase [Sphingomonadales bacterium]